MMQSAGDTSRDLAVGYNCRFLQGPETDPAELQILRDALKTGQAYSGELINYKQDGTRFWNRLTLYPIRLGENDTPDYYVANQVDVTALRQRSGLPQGTLDALQQDAEDARLALRDADRFSEALRQRVTQSDSSSPEVEAFLLADQQAHGRLLKLIEALRRLTANGHQF